VESLKTPILFIDNEQPVIDSLSLMLRSNGTDNVVACTDSRKALSMLRGREILDEVRVRPILRNVAKLDLRGHEAQL
jgi:CheY-like chemotaxis protein